ncbi:MAG: class I SAM-dependent methyltransferase [Anaerolineales bacterium]
MEEYNAGTYGKRHAEIYDEFNTTYDPACVEMLAELSQGGLALELGIGTGRIALPLFEKGVSVQGIDASNEMLDKLRAKPGGTEIDLVTGSFAQFDLQKQFSLVYVVYNTFFALLSQSEQVRCFKSVKKHLSPEGVFVIEAFVPDPCRYENGQTIRAVRLTEKDAIFDISQFNPERQIVTTQHVWLSQEGFHLYPVKLRYAWPSELDLMAQLAGLSLRHRWSSWSKKPFTRASHKHISVYSLA